MSQGSPNLSLAGVGGRILIPPVDNSLIKGAHTDLVAVDYRPAGLIRSLSLLGLLPAQIGSLGFIFAIMRVCYRGEFLPQSCEEESASVPSAGLRQQRTGRRGGCTDPESLPPAQTPSFLTHRG